MKDELNITSVRLSEKAFGIKKELAPIYGLKNILSAGLILFDKLSDTEQKHAIKRANGVGDDPTADAAQIASSAEQGAKQLNKRRRGVRESRAKAQ